MDGQPEHDATLHQIAEMLSRPDHTPALNANLVAFLRDRAVRASLGEGPTPGDESVSDADAFSHLWNSIDLSITRCPACEQLMDPNWGWCPYHADPSGLPGMIRQVLQENPKQGPDAEEQLYRLLENPRFGDPKVKDHLKTDYDSDRLLVHWTEFEVFRNAVKSDTFDN